MTTKFLRPHRNHGLVREGLLKIAEKFASPSHVGPKWVTDSTRSPTSRSVSECSEMLMSK